MGEKSIKVSEIKAKYPSGTIVIDCFGQKNKIIGSYLQVSEFRPCYVLGGVWLYNWETGVWAEKIEE